MRTIIRKSPEPFLSRQVRLFSHWMLLALALALPQLAVADVSLGPIKLFRQAAELLETANGFTVHVEKDFDVILNDGAKVQYSGAADVFYQEDLGLYIDYGDDISAKKFWYEGKSVVLLDTLADIYVAVPAQGSVSEVLEIIEARHQLRLPMASFMRPDLAADFEAAVVKARHLGIHDVDGVPCHHLLFQGETEDWQIWIDSGDKPLIRKMVIQLRTVEGAPQQAIYLNEWDIDPELDAKIFNPQIPDDAVRTEFVQ